MADNQEFLQDILKSFPAYCQLCSKKDELQDKNAEFARQNLELSRKLHEMLREYEFN